MNNSSYTSLGIIVAAAVMWGAYGLKSQLRGTQRDRSVLGEEKISSPSASHFDVAARGPIGPSSFDIKTFGPLNKTNPKETKEVHRSLREMQRLLKCFESENCNFDQATAQSYRTALRETLSNEILNFQKIVENNNFQDPSLIAKASDVTKFFLSFPDDDIKDQAISLASSLPISNEICATLISGLSESSSAPLYEKGIGELKRYIGTSEKSRIDAFLVQSLVTGSGYVSKLVARESLPFISSENTPKFLEVLNQLPKRSQEFEMLKANVNESMRL